MSKVKVSSLIESIQIITNELEADFVAFQALDKLNKSVHMCEARLENLQSSFEEARAMHQRIIAAPTEEAKTKYMEELTFHKLKELFYKYSSILKEQLHTDNAAHSGLNKSILESKLPSSEFKLPPIKIPTFSGSFQMWPEFKNLFEGLVSTNTSISNAQKLHYLKANLSGEAERLLRNTAITDGNFDSAWAILIKRYQNVRLLKENQFQLLFNQPKSYQESSDDIKALLDTTNEASQALKNLGVSVKAWEDVLVFHTVQKLPLNTRGLWESHIATYADYPNYSELEDFMLMRARTLEIIGQASSTITQSKSNRNAVRSHNVTVHKCSICQGSHAIRNCFKFRAFSPNKRNDMAKKYKLCFNCLSSTHSVQTCTSKFTCSTCKQKHHSLLHLNEQYNAVNDYDSRSTPANQTPTNQTSKKDISEHPTCSTNTASANNAYVAETNEAKSVLLATARIKVFTTVGQPLVLRALLDPGSETSLISESVAQILQLKREKVDVQICGIGENKTGISKYKVSFPIYSNINNKFKVQLNALVLPKVTADLPMRNIKFINWNHIQNLELADPTFYRRSEIDVLLGADIYPSIILEGIIKGVPGSPMAQRTELGWVLSGGVSSNNKTTSLHITTNDLNIDKILLKFWELEEIGTKKMLSPEDKQCERHFSLTHQRQRDGRYVVRLPFRDGKQPLLGLSLNLAKNRFFQLEKKLNSNSSFRQEYKRVLEEYRILGHMTEVDTTTLTAHYYVPHHAVIKESSTTTKLRIVFDASCKSSNGTSLNDHLLVGPRLQDDIFDHITRFRKHKIAFVADINKMYRQIWVAPKDSVYQLILWRDKEDEELKAYQLNTVTFGTAAAPYLAVRTLQQLASDERDDFPLASKIAKQNFYVDDVMHGADSVKEALELQQQLIAMLKRGGFPLRKWASNSQALIEAVPEADREVSTSLAFDDPTAIKTLGIQWHPGRDTFSFKLSLPEQRQTTKRTILSGIARFYDPMGWISPCVLLGKILMQDIWKEHQSWDSELPTPIIARWHYLKTELTALNNIEIPRWIHYSNKSCIEIHGFCDASEKAYAAALYVRVINGGTTFTNLLLSKTRIAPLKTKSLARLELCGALLLAHLLVHTINTMNLQDARIHAWSDSQITLAWIKSPPHTRTTFVANRVAEIQELTNPKWWKHVISKDNPADIASRGLTPRELVKNRQWWHGPDFLQLFEEQAHLEYEIPNTDLESKPSNISKVKNKFIASGYPIKNIFQLCIYTTSFEANVLLSRFSSLQRLVRVTAYWLRFINNARKNSTRMSGPLSLEEIELGQRRLVTIVQQEFFSEEIRQILKNKEIHKGSKLARLVPFIDTNGILRVGGRLENADLPYDQRHPIILPSQNILTSLIVHDAHMKSLHGGQQLMMATLRTKYWIIRLKSNVKKCIRNCLRCFRHNAPQMHQKMGNLPASRVTQTRPFHTTGVDYAGPVQLKAWKRRCNKVSKAFIAIFICFTTKAVHLELVSDYSSPAFLAAFKRFTARRGICENLYSDCGTNFQGAAKILDKERTQLSKQCTEDIAKELLMSGTKWHFNPPGAPHFGGLWEAGVKSMKHHLKRVIGHHTLTFEEYATVLAQVEACLNSRPLCPMTEDPEDLSILTPGHFLIGTALSTTPERDLAEIKENQLDRWHLLQRIQQNFWRKWKSEYLARLQQRTKWLTSNDQFKVGQLVILPDEQMPPTQWRLGRIEATHPGTDGKVRVVTIKTATTTLKRPIVKICLLPIEN